MVVPQREHTTYLFFWFTMLTYKLLDMWFKNGHLLEWHIIYFVAWIKYNTTMMGLGTTAIYFINHGKEEEKEEEEEDDDDEDGDDDDVNNNEYSILRHSEEDNIEDGCISSKL